MTAPNERTFFPLPISTGGGRAISAPFQFVTTGEDNLRVTVWNSQTACRVAIQGRRFDENGAIVPIAYSLTPTADRAATTRIFPLGVGAIVNLAVWAIEGAPAIGQTFVSVQLVRGREGGTELLGTLLQGYVTNTQTLGWPGSPIVSSIEGPGWAREFIGTNPAIGTPATEVVPTGARWELQSVTAILATDATAVNRTPRLFIMGSFQPLVVIPASADVAPSSVGCALFASGFGTAGLLSAPYNQNGLPVAFPLAAGTPIVMDAANFQAGDDWSEMIIHVREWIEVQ